MKGLGRKIISVAIVGFAIFGLAAFTTACSKSIGSANTNNNNNGGTTPITPSNVQTPTQTVLDGTGGGQAALTLTSKSALDTYAGWVTNSPSNEAIGVNLVRLATRDNGAGGYDYEFGGAVSISFTDGYNTYIDTFSSHLQGDPNTISSDVQNNEQNLVSLQYPGQGGQPAYHGFFQGTTYCIINGSSFPLSPGQPCINPYTGQVGTTFGGAVILVLNHMGFNADGEGATTASGSIWFYNFEATTGAGVPGTNCWFVTNGPFQCGSFFNGSNYIQTKSSLNPTVTHLGNGSYITYTELGTFTNLNLNQALNGQLN